MGDLRHRAVRLPSHQVHEAATAPTHRRSISLALLTLLIVGVSLHVIVTGKLPLPDHIQERLGIDSMPLHLRQYIKRCSKDHHDIASSSHDTTFLRPSTNVDQVRVVNATRWAWQAYRDHAYGHDVFDSRSKSGHAWNEHNLGITLIDALDTLYIMGMRTEFDESVRWVRDVFPSKLAHGGTVSVFETTIRVLGGLLSAYHLSGQHELLSAADALGQRLSHAFTQTPSGFPHPLLTLFNGKSGAVVATTLAEVGTLQLEFQYLTQLTCNQKYRKAVDVVMDQLLYEMTNRFPDGLVPVGVDSEWGGVHEESDISFGADGDSYYEYLLKQWLFTDKQDDRFKDAYETSISSMRTELIRTAKGPGKLTILGSSVLRADNTRSFHAKMDHLSCFVPGMLALGALHGMPSWHHDLAKDLMRTCYMMYHETPSGFAPEVVYFDVEGEVKVVPPTRQRFKHNDPNARPYFEAPDFFWPIDDPSNVHALRPEVVESLMLLYHTTGDEVYREWGREIFQAFETHARLTTGGYATVHRLHLKTPRSTHGIMESFFLAETLKYFYLLFADTTAVLPLLQRYVMNTEAHLFRITSSMN
ncbi:hypothetical protein SDRG_13705 [Saprolegnia diclina VS20]|uniref:alpha-1,2-Mannosidase n=1 Tax=Saprolegnia diclina (strain VS20) TaxID=1156394 RepID=T0Q246_SAPDV|nr:hypothetical protein SDRG_13705 [Saprolegnia diclina VS20]EQC28626.1 hypothetical protein SDRG_13705 [Saprolegnia diclina VS20]|eukprot:XP_008618023.1 hypothetical protein SDRG_13705 [Saprolegnia diclina VS20]